MAAVRSSFVAMRISIMVRRGFMRDARTIDPGALHHIAMPSAGPVVHNFECHQHKVVDGLPALATIPMYKACGSLFWVIGNIPTTNG